MSNSRSKTRRNHSWGGGDAQVEHGIPGSAKKVNPVRRSRDARRIDRLGSIQSRQFSPLRGEENAATPSCAWQRYNLQAFASGKFAEALRAIGLSSETALANCERLPKRQPWRFQRLCQLLRQKKAVLGGSARSDLTVKAIIVDGCSTASSGWKRREERGVSGFYSGFRTANGANPASYCGIA
jgi:hypothetical protein